MDKVPAWETVTVFPASTVTFPTVVVAKVTVEFCVKRTFDPEVQAVVNGPAPDVPQFAPVQVADVPSARQNCCACASELRNPKAAVKMMAEADFLTKVRRDLGLMSLPGMREARVMIDGFSFMLGIN